MSGGYFDYVQFQVEEAASMVKEQAHARAKDYKPETIKELNRGAEIIKLAAMYLQRIDYLFSDDDSEETFLERISLEKGYKDFRKKLKISGE